MNQWVLVGHRGVGKTSLLEKMRPFFPNFVFQSLDREIENRTQLSTAQIFADQGEESFRKIENQVFRAWIKENQDEAFVLDLGAGFLGEIPESLHCLWIRRDSHTADSMYLNRPLLDGSLALGDKRFRDREKKYQTRANVTLELREGPDHFQQGEVDLFRSLLLDQKESRLSGFYFTVSSATTSMEINLLKNLGVRGFEFRDDLVKDVDFSKENALFSLRKSQGWLKSVGSCWDWPLEWGLNTKAPILSMHQRQATLEETLETLPKTDQILKLAIQINDFSELKRGHQWAQQDPQRRAFLPMSAEGRWSWYRQWVAPQSPLQFLRLNQGSAPDQPTILQVLNSHRVQFFAAVLGKPVRHSWTPTFHQSFFRKKNAPVFAIDISEKEWDQALPFLTDLGLRWAAVTSPLKHKAAQWVGHSSPINTLCLSADQWMGKNTDVDGFKQALLGVNSEQVAVWGGGGTLEAIGSRLPGATFFSSRTGAVKAGNPKIKPEILIWAVGRQVFTRQGVFPPEDWPLKKVIDLNYASDSPGIACAGKFGCQYSSGEVMFVAQAQKQQEFWNECGIK